MQFDKRVSGLGLLWEVILKKDIGKHLYEVSQKAGLDFFRISMKISAIKNGYPSNKRLEASVNTEIEINE